MGDAAAILRDKKIYEFCDQHPRDPDCLCLHPDPVVERIGTDLLLPYYCWYEPCKRTSAKIPTALKHNIERCNVTDCVISLGDVRIEDGALHVNNSCLSNEVELAPAPSRARPLPRIGTRVPVLHPRYLPLCLMLVSLILAIR
ncbi:IMV membrane protein [Western grey kangaroopox virus]|uniref:IMV membrane protein n=1 Tax=Western grey kangaroopox virus TaxID=1566307 RepID=A0A2C9DSN0_9POXV|nr:IMV membrane protein [Western grey kangaroopox virus]ATI21013.1 IMV membrane protein [Western grey kangaroopox virus]